jgi:amino acid transporter
MWATGMMTNVVFIKLFLYYLRRWVPGLDENSGWLVGIALIWVVHFINVRGIDMVGNASIVLTIALLAPFVVMTVLGVAGWKVSPFAPFANPARGGILPAFGASLGLSIFLYSGYDKLSSVAEEVENPQRNFPPALTLAVTMACVSYVVPTMVAVAALGNWTEWGEGYFPTAAARLGGPWLGHAIAAAGLCSNALLLNVTMLAISRIPLALAEDNFLPGMLSRHHERHGTPTVSLIAGSIAASVLCRVPLESVLVINNWLQMTTNLLIFANLWRLRRMGGPDRPATFRFPGGTPGLAIGTLVISTLAVFAMVSAVWGDAGVIAEKLAVASSGLLSGALAYGVLMFLRGRTWRDVDARREPRE